MRRILLAIVASCSMLPPGPAITAQQAPVLTQLAWFDRTGRQIATIGPLGNHGNIELSPDGTRVAVALAESGTGTRNLWIYERDGRRTQLTSDPSDENWLIWSADGGRVVFNAFSRDVLALVESAATPGATRLPFLGDSIGKWPVSWSADGSAILIVTSGPRTSNDVWTVPMRGTRRPAPFATTVASENWATFSPDGKWVAYSSTEADGRPEVYVAPHPPDGRKVRVSRDGGTQARWRTPGEILFVSPDRQLMSAAIQTGAGGIQVTSVSPLFAVNHPFGAYHGFDVTSDGQRILVNATVVEASAPTRSVRNSSSGEPQVSIRGGS